ncbi:MAG: hypothetical protein Q9218_002231 [Villophora microphyllina]
MATETTNSPYGPVAVEGTNGTLRNHDDPFARTPTMQSSRPHRYSSFDSRLFAEDHPSSSPSQAKKALEAHLAETDRRLSEASRLGTTLVEQRQKLSARLREVEAQQNRNELGPELRKRLIDIEKEYNEVGRESARAFLGPRNDSVGAASESETPFALDGRKSASPAKFSSHANDSPSKVSVPRKQRNQASNQIHDIEFAAEISTSLLSQVRQLQGMLSEKDEALKATNLEVSRLEQEAQGFAQRIRSMDESEQRYKDENWSLETQLHELSAEHKEATTREHKIQQALSVATSEKNATLRELDDLKQTHGKALEDHAHLRKNQDSELGSLRRDLSNGEGERSTLQRKLDEMTSQNQELAKAVAGRSREEVLVQGEEVGSDPDVNPIDRSDTDHSPPPSPTKGGQRHSMLESETLKSSLHHAHRMIQNLKGNVHREKTEKLELKRMLQEARDELDVRRSEGPNQKRLKQQPRQDLARKPVRPNMLGAGRNSRTDIAVDEPGWEDRGLDDSPQPLRSKRAITSSPADPSQMTDISDAYQTANETEDGFETAHERDYPTENEAFQTGNQSMAGHSSDDLTETEGGTTRGGTVRGKRPTTLLSAKADGLSSFRSTASTSADEDDSSLMTPNQAQPQKYRLKVNRGTRRSQLAGEGIDSRPSTAKGSPASFISTPGQGNQNLFAELDDLNSIGSGEEGTPSRVLTSQRSTPSMRRSVSSQRPSSKRRRSSVSSQRSSRSLRPATALYDGSEPPMPRMPVVDSGTMTEPWQPEKQVPEPTTSGSTSFETPSKATLPGTFEDTDGSVPPTPPSQSNQDPIEVEREVDSPSTAKSTPPRTVWDQPLSVFQNIIPSFGTTINTTPLSAKSTARQDMPLSKKSDSHRSSIVSLPSACEVGSGTPASLRHDRGQTQNLPIKPELSLSHIQGVDIPPIQPPPTRPLPMQPPTVQPQPVQSTPPSTIRWFPFPPNGSQGSPPMHNQSVQKELSPLAETSSTRLNQGATSRILGSIFGPNEPAQDAKTPITNDDVGQYMKPVPEVLNSHARPSLPPMSFDWSQQGMPISEPQQQIGSAAIDTTDHGVQTVLSADQIEKLIKQKEAKEFPKSITIPPLKPLSAIGAVSPPPTSQKFQEPLDPVKGAAREQSGKEAATFAKGMKRPISSNSMRMSNSSGSHPPLPSDHQQAIAAATQRTSSIESPNIMGPPLAPASAYRSNTMRPRTPSRPRTPNDQRSVATPASKNSTTPHARYSTMRSRVSRRSSVSSFESELDQRFNIRLDSMPMPDGIDNGTDPRMIQAITQTMIGEFLWKYTRKAGRGEMSNNRHRRFFWVHPYTRTLYWSDKDPSTAGRAEMKAKSVAIQAVRVVADDNPMPPGLHRKSLVIITPGRSVKFTAQTSQHHETWFNALSYLLLRTGPEGQDDPGMTTEDLAEFNPNFNNRNSSRTRSSRISLASFRSRGKTPEPPQQGRSQSRQSTRQPTGAPPTAPSLSQTQSQEPQQQQPKERSRRNSSSLGQRITSYWKPNRGMSVSSRTSQQSVGTSAGGALNAGVYRPTSSQAGSRNGSETDLSLRERGGGVGGAAGLENENTMLDLCRTRE